MFDFLKTLGEGVLYTLLSPIILALLLIHMAVYVIVFFVMFIKRIVMFFQGKDMSIVSELDKAAKYHLQMHKKNMATQKEQAQEAASHPQPATIVQPIIIQTGPDTKVKAPQYEDQPRQPRPDPIDYSTKEITYKDLNDPERRD